MGVGTPPLLLMAMQEPGRPLNWVEDFVPFSLLHLLSVAFFVALMVGACWLGRCWRETPKEARFRRGWGWAVLAYSVWYTAWYFFPGNFSWQKSLPCQLCDLAAFVAGLAMVTHRRPLRTLLYFWGIGLSTQAFISPIIQMGIGSSRYWMFWVGHTMIVGSAVYDIVVCGYRPSERDLRVGFAVSVVYAGSMFVMDIWLSRWLGVPINYGFVGDTTPDNPTIMDKLGPWPGRVAILAGIVVVDYALLWALWPMARRLGLRWAAEPASGSANGPANS